MRGTENLFQLQLLKVRPSSPLFFFFFLFWQLEMVASGEKSRRRRAASGEKEPRAPEEDQTQNDIILGWSFIFFKSEDPKTTSF